MRGKITLFQLCLKKEQRTYRVLFFVICFAVMIAILISSFFSCMRKTEENRRTQIYGSWHFAVYNADEQVQERLANHAIIQCYGKMKLYGLAKQGETVIGNIGTVDFNTKTLGNMSFSTGRFPKGEHEIAAERNALEAMGYEDPQIGQSVQLTIQYKAADGDAFYNVDQTFRLSGILDNYSNLWKGPENSLLSFVTGNISEKYTPTHVNAYCEVKQDFLHSVEDLMHITGPNGVGVINDYAYIDLPEKQAHSSNDSSEITSSILHLILLLITLFVIFILLVDLLRQKGNDAKLMLNIGADDEQLINVYAKVFFLIAFSALLTGTLSGTFSAWIIYQIISKLYHLDIIFHLPFYKVLLDFILLTITVMVSFLLSILPFSIGNSFRESNTENHPEPRKKNYFRNRKSMTTFQIQRIFNRAHKNEIIYALVVVCCTCLALTGISFFAYEKYLDCLTIQTTYPMDYEFNGVDFNNQKAQPIVHMPETDFLKIKKSYGVKKVQAYKYQQGLSYTWNGGNQRQGRLILPNQAGGEEQCAFLGVSYHPSDSAILENSLYSDFVTANDFSEGRSVVLCLPDSCSYNTAPFNPPICRNDLQQKKQQIQMNHVQVGDLLVLKGPLGECEVEVSGILYTNNGNSLPDGLLDNAYTIIGSYQLAGQLYEAPGNETMELVHVFGNASSNLNRLDEEMANLSGNLYFRNLRIEKSDAAIKSYFCLFVVALIDLAILLSSLFIWRGGATFPLHSVNERIRYLYFLGMKKSRLLFLQLYNTFSFSVIGGCLAYFVILFINSLKYVMLNNNSITGDNLHWLALMKAGILNFYNILPIKLYAVFFCLFLILNLCVTFIPFFREFHFFTKRNK